MVTTCPGPSGFSEMLAGTLASLKPRHIFVTQDPASRECSQDTQGLSGKTVSFVPARGSRAIPPGNASEDGGQWGWVVVLIGL